jgi:hypothetical protein
MFDASRYFSACRAGKMSKFLIRGALPGACCILMPENDQQGLFFYNMAMLHMNA